MEETLLDFFLWAFFKNIYLFFHKNYESVQTFDCPLLACSEKNIATSGNKLMRPLHLPFFCRGTYSSQCAVELKFAATLLFTAVLFHFHRCKRCSSRVLHLPSLYATVVVYVAPGICGAVVLVVLVQYITYSSSSSFSCMYTVYCTAVVRTW